MVYFLFKGELNALGMGIQKSKPKPKPKPQPKAQLNPTTSIPALSNDIDALCALGTENDDDPEVELTEEDFNDPNLLVRFLMSSFSINKIFK